MYVTMKICNIFEIFRYFGRLRVDIASHNVVYEKWLQNANLAC